MAPSIPRFPTLLGPPELYQEAVATAAAATTGDSFMDLMVANFNRTTKYNPPTGTTENGSPTFLSTGNPCLDFFFHVVPDTPPETLNNLLKLAWDRDPLTALKLVGNLQGVRGTGKSDREGFYTAALWLHKHHPKTLACNVASFAEFGCFRDLLEILFRLLEGANARKLAKETRPTKKRGRKTSKWMQPVKKRCTGAKNESKTAEEKRIEKAKRVVDRFNRDPDFKFLHERVSDLFAECLRSDMQLWNAGDSSKISLAAKWCPSLDSSLDRITLLCETIAKKVFPREEYPEYEGVEEAHYTYRVRDRLKKQVLVPLRKALDLPEVYIGANDWGSIPYDRVASGAMKLYKKKFLKHDKERFQEYLAKAELGEAKIAADPLKELEWKRTVDDEAKKGKLNSCLAICDVSRSMSGAPMEASVALGVLVSELSEEPWKGKLITFSDEPKLRMVEGDSLRAKTKFVTRIERGTRPHLEKVFDVILKVALDGKLRPDEMIKRLFVFSDMEFDGSTRTSWETDYEALVRKFRKNGYGDCAPEIVFWNLRNSKATPVPTNQPGVALVSGFSKNLMSLFLEKGGTLSPEAVMAAAISGEEYQELVVID